MDSIISAASVIAAKPIDKPAAITEAAEIIESIIKLN